MEKEQREWWLFGLMAALIVTIVLLSWADVPAFEPPAVTRRSGSTTATGETAVQKVSINTATVSELMEVDGIGETMAERIVAYREEHGLFRSLDELLEVEGIGEKRLAVWRPYLSL